MWKVKTSYIHNEEKRCCRSFGAGTTNCAEIPGTDASTEELFDHLQTAVTLRLFLDRGIAYFQVFYYQAFTELGYYGFVTTHLNDLLIAFPNPTDTSFAPENAERIYKPPVMQDIIEWLQNEGNNIIYIYGGVDAWTGAAVEPTTKTNALKLVIPGARHDVRIKDFSEAEKQKNFTTLEAWLNIKTEY